MRQQDDRPLYFAQWHSHRRHRRATGVEQPLGPTWCYVVEGDKLTLVDTGAHDTYQYLEEGLKELGRRPRTLAASSYPTDTWTTTATAMRWPAIATPRCGPTRSTRAWWESTGTGPPGRSTGGTRRSGPTRTSTGSRGGPEIRGGFLPSGGDAPCR